MQLELNFLPTVQVITLVRRSVMSLYESFLDKDASGRIGLATHEMLENVLRHSVTGETTLQIRADKPNGRVTIETRNRASEANIAEIKARASSMGDRDPIAYYTETMLECADSEKEGGLGLARICAEAGMKLDVRTEGDCVCVVATTAVGTA